MPVIVKLGIVAGEGLDMVVFRRRPMLANADCGCP